MRPDSTIVESSFLFRKTSQVLAESGRQYAIYVFGTGPFSLGISIPAGTYQVEFMDPLSGVYEGRRKILSDGKITLQCPAFPEDVAIKIIARNSGE